ncbi:MAG: hypothetical protein IJR99_10485 [Kiritimatiellae bacterium]|nr:hypothetical protein [Kiritimatiellia bacterium]
MRMRVKKEWLFAACLLATGIGVASSAGDSAMLEFYTKGPDTYLDGSPVVEGETYLLIYVPAGSSFTGVDTRGEPLTEDNRIVTRSEAFVSTKGAVRCRYRTCDISGYPAGGEFLIVLLDTRVNEGKIGGHVDAYSVSGDTGIPEQGGVRSASLQSFSGKTDGGSAVSLLNAATDTPEFSTLTTAPGGAATVTLENLRAKGSYQIEESETLNGGWKPAGVDRVYDVEGSATVDVPRSKAKVRFFRVIGR